MRYLTDFEERLVELVHILSYGTPEEHGITVYEVKQFLLKKIPDDPKQTVLESIEESDKLLEDIRAFLTK